MSESMAFEMALDRMLIYSSGKTRLEYDRAAHDAIVNGMSKNVIAKSSTAFFDSANTLPAARSRHIRDLLVGGVLTRFKMETTGLQVKVAATGQQALGAGGGS